MRRFFHLLLLAGFVGCAPVATSQDVAPTAASSCPRPWSEFLAGLPADIPLTQVPHLPSFLRAFNAYPPRSDITADEVWVFRDEDHAGVLLFFVTDGCMVGNGALKDEAYDAMVGTAL